MEQEDLLRRAFDAGWRAGNGFDPGCPPAYGEEAFDRLLAELAVEEENMPVSVGDVLREALDEVDRLRGQSPAGPET